MVPPIDLFSPKKAILETYDAFLTLSNEYKGLSIALTILGTLCFIIPGLVLFRLSVVKFLEWENESKAKQTAIAVNNSAQTILNIALEQEIDLEEVMQPSLQQPQIHQKEYLASFASDFSMADARTYLQENGQPEDYILIKNAFNALQVVFLSKQNELGDALLFENPNGDFYFHSRSYVSLEMLNNLKNPLHPGLSQDKKFQIQGAIHDYKYLCLVNALSLAFKEEAYSCEFMGIDSPFDLYGLLDWLEACPDVAARERLTSSVLPFFAKAYGHIFGFKGEIEVNNAPIKLEGMFDSLAISLVGACQKQHVQESKLLSDDENAAFIDFIHSNCSYSSYEDAMSAAKQIHKDLKTGKIISISSGWKGHAINITISKEFVCYTNRGMRDTSEIGSSTYMYKIADIEKFDPSKIIKYFPQPHQSADLAWEQLMNDSIKEDLLLPLHIHDFGEQKVGNCSFINNVSNDFVMACIYKYRENKDFQEAVDFGKRFYREGRVHNKTMMVDFWKRLQSLVPNKKEHFKIFKSFNRLLFEKHKVTKKSPMKNSKEYELLYTHSHEILSHCSISLTEFLGNEQKWFYERSFYELPPGTFGFFRKSLDASQENMGISLSKEDPIEECSLSLESMNNSYRLSACIKFQGVTHPSFIYENVTTLGDLVNKVKEASKEAAEAKGYPDYKGLELKFFVP